MYPVVASSVIMLIWVNIGANFMLTVPIMLYRVDHYLRLLYKQRKFRKQVKRDKVEASKKKEGEFVAEQKKIEEDIVQRNF